jgi:hypothetical protein
MTKLNKLSVLIVFLPAICAQAETRNIWQIGKFDQSPEEFSSSAIESVRFEVGKSVPGKDWPRRQGIDHPSAIVFSLSSIEGVYSLKVTTRIFFLHPELSYSRSDF